MINKLVNSVLNQASFALSDSKDKILAASKKRAQEEAGNLTDKIPSPQDFKNQLQGLALDSPNSLQKVEQVYNKNKNLLEKSINKLERNKEELQAIKDKLSSIRERFNTLEEILNPIKDIIGYIRDLLPALDLILATQVTPTISGTIVGKIIELKKDFKDKIINVDNTISSIPDATNYFNQEIETLDTPLTLGITNIQLAIDQLKLLLDQLNTIYSNFILSLNIPDSTTGDNTGETNNVLGGTTLQEYLSNPDNLNTIISTVIIPTTKIYFERRDNGPGTELRQTGIIEIPIN